MGYAAIPYILAAVSAGVQYETAQKTAHQQDQTLAAGIRQRSARQNEIDKNTTKLTGDLSASNPAQDVKDKLAQYLGVLTANRNNAVSGIGDVTGASADYTKDASAAKAGVADYGNNVADIFSRIDAPQAQRTREGNMIADYGVNTDLIKRASNGEDFINNLKLQSIRPNPLMLAFATALKSYASNMGAGGAASSGGDFGSGAYSGSGGAGIPGFPSGP
jgi:hypothetical protein